MNTSQVAEKIEAELAKAEKQALQVGNVSQVREARQAMQSLWEIEDEIVERDGQEQEVVEQGFLTSDQASAEYSYIY